MRNKQQQNYDTAVNPYALIIARAPAVRGPIRVRISLFLRDLCIEHPPSLID